MTDFLFHILYLSSCLLFILVFIIWFYFENNIKHGKYNKVIIFIIDLVFLLLLFITQLPVIFVIIFGFTLLAGSINYGYFNLLVCGELMTFFSYITIYSINKKELYHIVRNARGIKTRKKGREYNGRTIVESPYHAAIYGISFLIGSCFIYLTNFNTNNIQINSMFFIISDLITFLLCLIFICSTYYILIHDYYILSNKKRILFTILNIIAFFIAVKNFFDYSYLIVKDDINFQITICIIYILIPLFLMFPTRIVNKYAFTNTSSIKYQRRENKFLKETINYNNHSLIYGIYMSIASIVLLLIYIIR